MQTDQDLRTAAYELRNFANTLLNIGGVTGFYITKLLSTATALDGQQPDERFANIPYRLANPRASKADRGAVGQPLGSNRTEPALQASQDASVPPQAHGDVNEAGSNGETSEKSCTFDPSNDPKSENTRRPSPREAGQ